MQRRGELSDAGYPVARALFGHAPFDVRYAPYGAGHGFDVPFVFERFVSQAASDDERLLARQLSWAHLDFASSSRPSPLRGQAWASGARDITFVDSTPSVLGAWREAQCDAWEAFGLP
ncbi:MAG: hypothetical protein AMXMBFR34_48600 [Myxococcaceae bacterium]